MINRNKLICTLSLLTAFSVPAAAAPVLELDLKARDARLIVIDQPGIDLIVDLDANQQKMSIDHPLGASGPELLLAGHYASDRRLSIELRAKYPTQTLPAHVDIQVLETDPADLPALRDLTRAGNLSASGDPASLREAISLYGQAAARDSLSVAGGNYAFYPLFLQAALYYQFFDLPKAAESLALIPPQVCAVPAHCFKESLLEARIRFYRDEYSAAIPLLLASQKGLAAIPPQKSREEEAEILQLLGIAMLFPTHGAKSDTDVFNRLETARLYLQQSLEIAQTLAHPALLGNAHNGLATYYYQVEKDMVAVLEHLQNALRYLEQSPGEKNLLSVMVNLMHTYRDLGEYALAQNTAHKALAKIEAAADKSLLRGMYKQLGELYVILGDGKRAEHYARLAISLDIESGRNGRLHEARTLLGQILRDKGALQEAIRLHQQSLNYFDSLESGRISARILAELTLDHLALGEMAQARQYFRRSLALAETDSNGNTSSQYLLLQARLELAGGQPRAAIDTLSRLRENGSEDRPLTVADKVEISELLMQAYADDSQIAMAIALGEEAIALSNNIQGQLEFYRLGPKWSSKTNLIYKKLADLLLQRYYQTQDRNFLNRAFSVHEQSLAISLVQQRSSSPDTGAAGKGNLAELRRRLTTMSRKRASASLSDLEYETISQQYYRSLELYQSQLLQGQDALALGNIQAITSSLDKIRPGQAVLEFICVPEKHCHLFSLHDGIIDVVQLGTYEEVNAMVKEARTDLISVSASGYPGIEKLSKRLVPAIRAAGKKELLVVSDQPLNAIPLAALNLDASVDRYRPLITEYSLAHIPSLSALETAEGDTNYDLDVAVLANPIFQTGTPSAPPNQNPLSQEWVNNLEALPWTAVEARNVEHIFAGSKIRIYAEEAANRSNLLKQETRNARILHIASHAFFNRNMADLVGIALSSEADQDASESGDFVSLQELFAQPFHSELVVISGCETGQGEYLAGEGSMSLARGFLAQGVDHVISTLWPIADRASAEFMKLFYQALHQEGLDAHQALQDAQKKMAEHSLYQAPFYWAPYLLTAISI